MTEFLTDLIWVGNTLYPRWFVFAVMVLPFLAIWVSIMAVWVAIKINKSKLDK